MSSLKEKIAIQEITSPFDESLLRIEEGYQNFQPAEYVPRLALEAMAQHRVEAAQTGETEYPLVEFYGAVGQGKSWLVTSLAKRYWHSAEQQQSAVTKPTLSAKIDFGRGHNQLAVLQSLHDQLATQLSEEEINFPSLLTEDAFEADRPNSESINNAAAFLAASIVKLTDRYVPVLVFDATEKADEKLLDWLEKQVVYPIIRTNQTVFVFSGRLCHRWKIFEVRKRVETTELPPLDPNREKIAGTTTMLTKLGVGNPEKVAITLYNYAFGHPLVSRTIIEELEKLTSEGIIDKQTIESNQDAIAEIVRKVVENRFFEGLGEYAYLESPLWNVCILRKFSPTFLGHFAASFIDGEYEQQPDGVYLDAIQNMQTALVQWNSAAGGYILNPVVRKIMAKNLSMREPTKFQQEHQEAVTLYDNFIKQFPRNAIGYLIERTFHQNWALQDGKNQQEIGKILVSEFDKILKDVEKRPDVQWDLLNMAVALNEKLAKDEELMEVISEDAFEKLRDSARKFREGVIDKMIKASRKG